MKFIEKGIAKCCKECKITFIPTNSKGRPHGENSKKWIAATFCSKKCSATFTGRGQQKTLGKHWKVKDTSKLQHNRYPYHFSEVHRKNFSEAINGMVETYRPKNGKVGYRLIHQWVNKMLGKAIRCSNNPNHKSTRYHWANISGEYKKDLEDWRELCPSCNRLDGVKIADRFLERRIIT